MKGDSFMSKALDIEDEEKEEENETKRNIILLIWGVICLITAFVLNKVDNTFEDITWQLFSLKEFYSSLSFYSFILYTIGYLPLLFCAGKECLEEMKEGNIINENTLMIVATLGAFAINEYPEALFVILFSIIGEALEEYATSKSKKSIKSLVNDMPLYAHTINKDGNIEEKNPEDLIIGDIIEIRPGEKIAVDGKIIKGSTSLDQSSINGESLPREVTEGDFVYSGSININSLIQLEVTKEYKNSTLSIIMNLVENEQEKKAKTEKFITKFAKIYTPIVIAIAVLIFIIGYGVSGWSFANGGRDWLYKALSILLISCPCSLVIAVPISFFSAIGVASKEGILIKGSITIEQLSECKNIAFDKTGTLTTGKFELINSPDKQALQIAASLESKSTHPLAKAIVESNKEELLEIENFENIPGYGIKGVINGAKYIIGNKAFLSTSGVKEIKEEDTPYKVLYLAIENDKEIASFIVADKVKDEAKQNISCLKSEGYKKTIMLSGDDKKIAFAVGNAINLDEVKGELLPEQKLAYIKETAKTKEKICYVGDGINDSPSLLASNVGIAMGALGSDAAIEASDIVIMDDSLNKVTEVRHLSKRTMFTVKAVIMISIVLKVLFMILVTTGVLGNFAMIVSGLSDTGIMIICVLVALTIQLYKPKYVKS